jgi:hypothetical protein
MGSIHNLGNPPAIGPSDSLSPARKASNQPSADQVQLATVPLPAQVDQLPRTEPSTFKAILSSSIQELRIAASQCSDPAEAAYLSGLANRFQRLEAEEDSSPVQDPPS